MIGLPSSVAEIEPPTGISLSLATCSPPPEEAYVAPPADVAPPELVELSAEALAVDGAEVVGDDDEPELHPVSTKTHRPAAPAPPAQSTVRRVR